MNIQSQPQHSSKLILRVKEKHLYLMFVNTDSQRYARNDNYGLGSVANRHANTHTQQTHTDKYVQQSPTNLACFQRGTASVDMLTFL